MIDWIDLLIDHINTTCQTVELGACLQEEPIEKIIHDHGVSLRLHKSNVDIEIGENAIIGEDIYLAHTKNSSKYISIKGAIKIFNGVDFDECSDTYIAKEVMPLRIIDYKFVPIKE